MPWTVILEDENGNEIKSLPEEFALSEADVLYNGTFKILNYLDPLGDTTFNRGMIFDLITDLEALKTKLPTGHAEIEEVIKLALECSTGVHTYLKFYGD